MGWSPKKRAHDGSFIPHIHMAEDGGWYRDLYQILFSVPARQGKEAQKSKITATLAFQISHRFQFWWTSSAAFQKLMDYHPSWWWSIASPSMLFLSQPRSISSGDDCWPILSKYSETFWIAFWYYQWLGCLIYWKVLDISLPTYGIQIEVFYSKSSSNGWSDRIDECIAGGVSQALCYRANRIS